jgi:hypothetical protein
MILQQQQATTVGAHVLLPLAVNSKSVRKVDSLPPLGFNPATFGMQAHISHRSAKSQPCHPCTSLKNKGVGLGRVVREVRQHPDDHEFEFQRWQ